MRKLLTACVLALTIGSANAATVDLADGAFTLVAEAMASGMPLGVPEIFSETVDGVTFTFSATQNLEGSDRFNDLTQPDFGLQVGGGGESGGSAGSVIAFTLEVDAPVTLDSYSTVSGGFFIIYPTFSVNGSNVVSAGNTVPEDVAGNLFNGGPLPLDADTLYTFNIENPGAAVQGFIAGIDFTTVVPVPAPIVLLASGLLGVCARRRSRA